MSDDLIRRAEVIKVIDELGYVNCHNGKDFEANSRVDKIRQKIIELPTAYDEQKMTRKQVKSKMNKANEKVDEAADERMTVIDARKMLQVMNICCKGLIFTKSELCQISMVCMKALEREEKKTC